MSWINPRDVGFAARRQLAGLGHGARLFFASWPPCPRPCVDLD